MKANELLFKDLSIRLPYGLIVSTSGGFVYKTPLTVENIWHIVKHNDEAKPILRPFSDIYEVIIHKGKSFIPSDLLESDDYHTDFIADTMYDYLCDMVEGLLGLQFLPHGLVLQFIEWHLDVNGLIPKGLAIDVNTLETNPYQ